MIKKNRCKKFELDENTGKCKYYGGSLKHIAACYGDCKKRRKRKTEKDKLKIELEKCYIGAIVV